MKFKDLTASAIGNVISIAALSYFDVLAFNTVEYVMGLFVGGTTIGYFLIQYMNAKEYMDK